MGTTWQVIANLLAADKVPIKTVLPKEGSTGWSDTWMLSSKAQHPNCMAKWMNWIETPEDERPGRRVVRRGAGQPQGLPADGGEDALRHVQGRRQAFYDQVKFWATPTKNCRDGRGNQCVDYSKWVQAWTDIKG